VNTKVQEVATKTVWTCRSDEPLSAAAKLMWEHDIGAVPVLNGEGELVGIVTDRDACVCAYFAGEPLAAVPIERAMSRVVFTIDLAQTIEEAEELMRSKQVRRLAVVDAGELVGMLSVGDLAQAAQTWEAVTPSEVNATLAAIVEPRQAAVVAAKGSPRPRL
jgi:CBS domain-containing protein